MQIIYVIDLDDFPEGVYCMCGGEIAFQLRVSDVIFHLCPDCLATLGKAIIDGLT